MDKTTIDKILKRCLKNERSAQNELFHYYAPFIMATIRRYVSDEFVVKDVFLKSFEKAFTRLDQFDAKKGEFKYWLKTISINESLNALKNKSFIKSEEITDFHMPVNDSDIDLEIDVKRIIEVVNKLKKPYNLIFNLVLDGYKHKEISSQLNITEATSRSYFKRSRKMIIDQLQTQKLI